MGNGLAHLFEFPDQLDRLRSDPDLDTNAIEELLRFDSPIQFARRIAAQPLEIDGVAIEAGSPVMLGLGSANRDPEKVGCHGGLHRSFRPRANETPRLAVVLTIASEHRWRVSKRKWRCRARFVASHA